MQDSPPQGGSDLGSELGSVEDAAGYHLRQQLRAAAAAALAVAAELRACQAERDRALAVAAELRACQAERDQALVERDQAVVAAAELRAAGQRGEAQSFRNAEALQTARLRIRAIAAAERRSVQRSKRPARGEFDIPSDYAVPSNIRRARHTSYEHRLDEQGGQAGTGHRHSPRPGSEEISADECCLYDPAL